MRRKRRAKIVATLGPATSSATGHQCTVRGRGRFAAVQPGDEMLLDDGRLRLNVTSKSNAEVETQVLVGGRLSDRKGINLPGVMLPISPVPSIYSSARTELD